MTLVSKTIPSLINGISQQPPILRLPSQGESQINGYSSPVDGLTKRPPTEHVALITNTDHSADFLHTINRSTSERYTVILQDGDLLMYDFEGNIITVSFPDGKGYLNVDDPATDFVAVTLADTTFILNKTVTVAKKTSSASGTLKGTKQLFSDLPTTGMANGDVWKIQGTTNDRFAIYYVQWVSADSVWKEVTEPGSDFELDPTTMPHELAKTGTSTYEFREIAWEPRKAGDDDTNPFPGFIDRQLKDLFFIDNRMALVVDDMNVYSEESFPENFFRTTVTTLVDSDPTQGAATTNEVAILKFAVPWNGSIVEFSDTTQFLVPKDVSLKPPGVPLKATTQYESSLTARPAGAGQEMFFLIPKGSYSGLRSYYIVDANNNADADEITAHVPHFLPTNIFKMPISTNENIVLMLSLDKPNRVYVYQYFNQRTDSGVSRAQSAFHYWEFNEDEKVLSIETIGSTAHLWIQRPDGLYHDTLPLNSGQVEPEYSSLKSPFLVQLDRKTRLTGVYDSGNNTTTWTLPYPDTSDFIVVKGSGWSQGMGADIKVSHPTATTLVAIGDYSAHPCIVGRKYNFSYTFSEFVVTRNNGASNVAVTTGTLTLNRILLSYFQTGYFKVTVTTRGTDSSVDIFNRTIGDPENLIGEVTLETGVKGVGLNGEPKDLQITISSDSYLPCKFLNATWEGEFTNVSQGI